MSKPGTNRDELEVGIQVEINPQKDRTRKQRVKGKIKEILTNSSHHTHGILVSLENGEIGRVKKIFDSVLAVDDSLPSNQPPVSDSTIQDAHSLIAGGENHFVEFKSSILWSAKFSGQQIQQSNSPELKKYGKNASKFIIAKSIAGFLNSDGGDLLIGIKEDKDGGHDEVIGIESEFPKLKDQCIDGYRRMIIDQVIKQYFPKNLFNQINHYIQMSFEEVEGKTVCCIHANKSDTKVFLTNKKDAHFFIRVDASTREIQGEEVVDYCMKRFR